MSGAMRRSLHESCPDGVHKRSRNRRGQKYCRRCYLTAQTIGDHLGHAFQGGFRVVCATDGCDYGDHVDRDGHGYTNHSTLSLAKAELVDHQHRTDETHSLCIQQHPVEAVAGQEARNVM